MALANPAPANEDNPPPPPGLLFEDYKKTIKIEFYKPYPSEFVRLISPYKVESILPLLQKCVLITPSDSDEEGEIREAENPPKSDAELVEEVWALIQKAKAKKEIPPGPQKDKPVKIKKEYKSADKPVPSTSRDHEELPDAPPAFLVGYSPSPSPEEPDSSIRKKSKSHKSSKSSSKHSRHRHASSSERSHHRSTLRSPERSHSRRSSTSRSPEGSYRRREKSARSPERSHRKYVSPPPGSYTERSHRKYVSPPPGCSPERSHRKYVSPPPHSSHRSKSSKSSHSRHRSHRRRSNDSRSPEESRHRRRSYDSRSPEDSYYRQREEERYRHRKAARSPTPERIFRSRTPERIFRSRTTSPSPDPDDARRSRRSKKDPSPKASSSKFVYPPPDPEDEYSAMLREAMKNRHLIPDSPKSVSTEKSSDAANMATPVKMDSEEEELTPLPEDQASALKFDLGIVDESEKPSDAKFVTDKYFKDVKVKKESIDAKTKEYAESKAKDYEDTKAGVMSHNFFCDLCQLGLNSEVTWKSHITGKKHAKAVKLQTVHEIAKGSISIPITPAVVTEDVPRFANAPAGRQRIRINETPRLQSTIDDTTHLPVPGLDHVQEIISPMDVDYYCELCDAPCKSSSIMPHLIGFKHQLRALRELFPDYYERNKSRSDKTFKDQVISRLRVYEKKSGRGSIKVFKEIDDPRTRPAYDMPGPSRRSSDYPSIKKEEKEGDTEAIKDRWLDMSKGDFFCTLCDSHMNNVNMWEAHVRGKRHLTNAKKIPGENPSKMKSEKLPGATSKLEDMINDQIPDELIVGLDFIRETRGPHGELYNCFLCGSCSTNFDILDHILLQKHRTRYLEKMHVDGKDTSIEQINQLELKDNYYRESLINDECYRMVELYGRGRVEVYKQKN